MYLLLFNATPAPSPAIELLSDSHSWGMLLRAHSMSPCSLGIPGRRDPPHTPRRRDLCPGTHSDRKSPLSSSTCHAVPHREQQTPNSRHPWGLPSLSPSAPRVPPGRCQSLSPPTAALSSRPPLVTRAVPRGSRTKSATLTHRSLLPPASPPPLPAAPRRACPASLRTERVSFETPFVLSHTGPDDREKTQEDRSDTGSF